jgi:hypothetical protein
MVAAAHQLSLDGPRNECVFSPCRKYRYTLRRWLNPDKPEPRSDQFRSFCLWLLANPSIADEYVLDPTLTRCAAFTRAFGFDEMRVVNVRAFVATDPKDLPSDPEAIGPDNLSHIHLQSAMAAMTICGWGKLGGELGRSMLGEVAKYTTPRALRLNQDGSPQHPLYLPASLRPFAMVVTDV